MISICWKNKIVVRIFFSSLIFAEMPSHPKSGRQTAAADHFIPMEVVESTPKTSAVNQIDMEEAANGVSAALISSGPSSKSAKPMPSAAAPVANPYPKPPYSYASLIGKAILDAEEKRARLNTIYNWIADNYPYYKLEQGGWQAGFICHLTL